LSDFDGAAGDHRRALDVRVTAVNREKARALARGREMIYKGFFASSLNKEPVMKTILAAMLAGAFFLAVPSLVRADDQAPAGVAKGKKNKKADKGDKGEKKDDAAKTGGGW
jgi:hypothetical protein